MVLPPKRGSDGSYSSFSSSSSRGETRKYLDPWDIENALYVRGKRISFASDPNTYSAASAALGEKPAVGPSVDTGYRAMAGSYADSGYKAMSPLYEDNASGYKQVNSCVDSGYCYCEYESPPSYVDSSLLQPEPVPSMRYLSFCPYCDAEQPQRPQQPKSLPYINTAVSNNNTGELSLDSCEECSVCSSVAPPPPLLLFSGVGGQALSAAGLHLGDECPECQPHATPSFSPSPRRASVPARSCQQEQPADELAYVYESPRARAKHSLPNVWSARDNAGKTRWVGDHNKRLSLAVPSALECSEYGVGLSETESPRGPHAPLLAPPRHPCRWGMARSGHIAIDYSNAWMSLARRIRPSRS